MIEKEEINNKFKWLENTVFKKYLELYLNGYLNGSEKNNFEELIKYLENDANILKDENNSIKENKLLNKSLMILWL